ncbi:MAG: hypothetical protein NTZ24_14355 [Deltaproteobacteria bacterium]|nr:hypothetical protein [Deltaproteobacteria bacterium]
MKGVEGYLRHSGNVLFILDQKAGWLVRITGLTIAAERGVVHGGSSGGFKE